MRVLVSYFFGEKAISLGESMARAFEENGAEVYRHHSEPDFPRGYFLRLRMIKSLLKLVGLKRWYGERVDHQIQQRRDQRLLQAVETFRPDLVLVIRGDTYTEACINQVRQTATAACWWVKSPKHHHKVAGECAWYDAYYSIHGENLPAGVRHQSAIAVAPERFSSVTPDAQLASPVLFIGAWTERRQQYLEAIADFPLLIIGPGWKSHAAMTRLAGKLGGDWVDDSTMLRRFASALVTVNVSQWEPKDSDAVNLRLVDVPGVGGVLLTDGAPASRARLAETGCVLFESPEELRQRLEELLKDAPLREQLSSKGKQYVQGLPSYGQIAGRMIHDLSLR